MNLIFKTALIFGFFCISHVNASEPCSPSKSSCYKSAPWTMSGVVHALSHPIKHANENAATYYAKGVGKTCEQAYQAATQLMYDKFSQYLRCDTCGDSRIKCGNNGSVYLKDQGCSKATDGTLVAWATCDNIFHSPTYSETQQGHLGPQNVGQIIESIH